MLPDGESVKYMVLLSRLQEVPFGIVTPSCLHVSNDWTCVSVVHGE